MVNNLSYANKALNINMEKELEKVLFYKDQVNSFLITQPVNPLNNNSFRFSFFNDDYHSKNSSPRFTHDKIIYDSAYINTFQEHLEDSIKDPLESKFIFIQQMLIQMTRTNWKTLTKEKCST